MTLNEYESRSELNTPRHGGENNSITSVPESYHSRGSVVSSEISDDKKDDDVRMSRVKILTWRRLTSWEHPEAELHNGICPLKGCSIPVTLQPQESDSAHQPIFHVIGGAYIAPSRQLYERYLSYVELAIYIYIYIGERQSSVREVFP